MEVNNNNWREELRQIPFVVRFIILTTFGASLANYFSNDWVAMHLPLEPAQMVSKYQLWRMATFWVYEPSLMTLIVMSININSFLAKFQIRNSSAVLFNDLFVNLYFFGFVFVCIEAIIGLFTGWYPSYTFSICFIWLNMLYKYSYYNSEQKIKLCFTSLSIKILYFPFIMAVLVFLFNFAIRYDALMGLSLAVLECRFFNGGMILFIKDTYEDKEKAMACLGFTRFECWQNLDVNKIQLNHRWTVSSSQFYLNLGNYQLGVKIGEEETGDGGSTSRAFKGTGVQIGSETI